jgi:hypothetical protein
LPFAKFPLTQNKYI